MRQLLILCGLLLALSGCQTDSNPEIDRIFNEWDQADVPGGTLGIIRDGQLAYARGFGMANLEYDIPNAPNTVFRIASTSKQFTAACVVLLARQGKLSLDDTLSQYFPDFPGYAGKIQVRHLLHHTSGIRDYLTLADLKGLDEADHFTDREVMKLLVKQQELNFQPGEEHLYSNSGYWLLGQLVNKVTGKTMAEFAGKELFGPLGMEDTHFHNDHTRLVRNRATGYAPADSAGFRISMTTLDMIGDGGIFTTVKDFKKWDDAFYRRDVLDDGFWELMQQQGRLNNGDTLDYASGLSISTYRGLPTISHGGAFVGYRAEAVRFPEERLTIVLFSNRADTHPTNLCHKVADVLLKHKLQPMENAVTTDSPGEAGPVFAPEELRGHYALDGTWILEVLPQGDSLRLLQTWNDKSYNVGRLSGNTYAMAGEPEARYVFSESREGKAQLLHLEQGGRRLELRRKHAADPAQVDTGAFAGSYYSPELDVAYHISRVGDSLQLTVANQEAVPLRLSDTDQLSSGNGLLRFIRNQGAVTGFRLDAGRVKNLVFNRM